MPRQPAFRPPYTTASLRAPRARTGVALCAVVLLAAACGGGGAGEAAAAAGAASGGAADAGGAAAVAKARFVATDADWPNPERGFYRASWSTLQALSAGDVQDAYQEGYRLLYTRLDLSAYRAADLPDGLLAQLEAAFARARAGGIKLIVRAAYNDPQSETAYRNAQDAPLDRVLRHIAQLKPLLQRYADVIAFVQAGFIGAWGEWHTSSNQLTAPAARTQVRDALLDAVPASRFVQLRQPGYAMDWAPTLPTLSAALGGAQRIGVHNDCFLASTTDVGTYDDDAGRRATQRDYVDRLGDLAPFGGETCDPADEADAAPRTTCADILGEGARYNLTYLNSEYYRPLFHGRWEQAGCMAEVRRRTGYRLQLLEAAHAAAADRGQSLPLAITVRNAGWARVFNPRGVQVLLRDASGAVRRLEAAGADPRAWTPGADHPADLRAAVPADLPAGSYEVWLALPDADSRLAADARYALRPANADDAAAGQRWDATLGAFALGTRVQVR